MLTPVTVSVVGILGFLWLLERVVRDTGGKAVTYVLWCVIGVLVVLASPVPAPLVTKVFAHLWVTSMGVLPAWWFYRWASRRGHRQ